MKARSEMLSSGGFPSLTSCLRSPSVLLGVVAADVVPKRPAILACICIIALQNQAIQFFAISKLYSSCHSTTTQIITVLSTFFSRANHADYCLDLCSQGREFGRTSRTTFSAAELQNTANWSRESSPVAHYLVPGLEIVWSSTPCWTRSRPSHTAECGPIRP